MNDTNGTADLSSTGSPTITHSQTEGMTLNKQGSASKYVSIPLGDIGMDSGKSWSLSWWYKIGSGVAWDGNGQDVVILGTRDHGVDYGLQLVSKYSLNANGIYCVYGFYGNDVFFYTGWPAVYTNVTNNQWVHFVIVYDKDNELGDGTHRKKMYVDGVELTNTSGVHNEWLGNNTTHKLDIGGRGWGSALNGNQHWLNLAIFDKALSLAEAQAIYAKDKYYGYGYEPTPISSISGSGVSCGTTSERDNLTYVEEGDVFYNTETSELQIYKNSVWRSLSHKIANDRNAFKITSGDSVPAVDSNSKEGNIYYNTNTGKLRIREESAWQVTSKQSITDRAEFKTLYGASTPSVNTIQNVFYNTDTKKLQYLKNDSWRTVAEEEVAGDTFNVGVDSYKFSLNNAVQPELNLYRGNEYVFNQSSADNSGQRLFVSNDLSGRRIESTSSGFNILAGGGGLNGTGGSQGTSYATPAVNSGFPPTDAFNNSITGDGDCWLSEHLSTNDGINYNINYYPELGFEFPSGTTKNVKKYRLWPRYNSNTSTMHNWRPRGWELRGAISESNYDGNDSSTYTILHTVFGPAATSGTTHPVDRSLWPVGQSSSNGHGYGIGHANATAYWDSPVTTGTNWASDGFREYSLTATGNYRYYVIRFFQFFEWPSPSTNLVGIGQMVLYDENTTTTTTLTVNTAGVTSTGTLGTDLVSTWTIPTDASDTMYYASDGSANAGGKINITNVPAQEKTFVVDVSLVQSQSGVTVIGLAGAGGLYTVGGSEYSSNPATIQINSGSHIFDGYYHSSSGWSPSNSSSFTAHQIWIGATENIINNTIDHFDNAILSNAPDGGTIDQNTEEFSVIITFPVSVVISEYKMWHKDPWSSQPKAWTLRATDNLAGYQQNNVLTYTQLDDRDSITGWVDPGSGTPNVNNANSYTFANTSAYKTYIINFTESNRTTHIALNELAYYGYVPSLENAFTLGGLVQPTLNLYRDSVYKFDQSDPDNVGQRLYVSNDLSGRQLIGGSNATVEFPRQAMTANTSQNCVATASTSPFSSDPPYKAFNKALGGWWHSDVNKYDNTNGNALTGAGYSSFEGIYGEWIQIHFTTESFFLKELKVYARGGQYGRGPDEGHVFGSLDGSTWTELVNFTGIINSGQYDGNGKTINVSATSAYSYYVLLTTKLSGNEHNINIARIDLNSWDPEITSLTENTAGVTSAGTLGTDLVTTWRVPTDASDTMYYASDGSANAGGTISITDAPTKKSRVRTLVSAGSNGGGDTYTKYAVDVSLNRFTIGGHLQPTLNLYKDSIYKFDQSDPDNVGQRLFVSNDLSGRVVSGGIVASDVSNLLIIHYEFDNNNDIGYNSATSTIDATASGEGGSVSTIDTNVKKFGTGSLKITSDYSLKTWLALPNIQFGKYTTFSFWINWDLSQLASGSTYEGIVTMNNSAGDNFYIMVVDHVQDNLNVVSKNNGASFAWDLESTATTILPENTWNHMVLTINDDTGEWKTWVNGSEVKTLSNAVNKFNTSEPFTTVNLGRHVRGGASIIEGNIDDFRIYTSDTDSNAVLTAAQITELYNSSGPSSTSLTENTTGFTSTGTLGTDLVSTWRVPTDASDTMYYASDGSANAGGKINVEVTPYEEKTYAADVSLNRFTLGGLVQPTLNLYRDSVYNFDQSDPDNVGQRLYVSNEAVIGGTNASTQFPKVNLTSATSVDCVVTASSSPYNGDPKWRAFDGNTGTFWQCQQNTYTNGVANTGANNSSFEGIYGEWIQIHFQVESFVLKELKVGARGGHGGPDEGYVFGSLDGSSWTQLTNFTGITNSGAYQHNGYKTIDISAPKAYSYYVLLTTLISANSTELNITEIQLHSWDPQRTILVENTNGVTSTGTLGTDLITRWRVPTDASDTMYYASDGSANAGGTINILYSTPTIVCLTTNSAVNVISSGGNKYRFNGDSTYVANKYYGLGSGTFTFTGVPSAHPIAILNAGKTSLISYTGDNANKSSKPVSGTTSDGTYDFYHGTVTVTVTGDFGSVSVYCYHHGYMGGENLLRYSNTCDLPSSSGGIETQYGGYRIHTFTSSGTFEVYNNIDVSCLIIGGGGGGTDGDDNNGGGGGGGAGGFLEVSQNITPGQYTIVVGAGGIGSQLGVESSGVNGNNSSFNENIALGGGGDSSNGGCGGGAFRGVTPGSGSQGGDGGTGGTYLAVWGGGGGGGGANENGGNGVNGQNVKGGNGGNGKSSNISGTATVYAGGGGGGSQDTVSSRPSGGAGGGGDGGGTGSNSYESSGLDGTDGLGGGGGGSSAGSGQNHLAAGKGGDGIVIIRYLL